MLLKNTQDLIGPATSYRQQILRQLLENKQGMTINELSQHLSISRTAVQNHFSVLEKKSRVGLKTWSFVIIQPFARLRILRHEIRRPAFEAYPQGISGMGVIQRLFRTRNTVQPMDFAVDVFDLFDWGSAAGRAWMFIVGLLMVLRFNRNANAENPI